MNKKNNKANNFSSTIKRILVDVFKNYPIYIIIILTFSISSTIFSIVGPKIMGKATTELFEGLIKKFNGNGGIDFDKISKILLLTLALYILSFIFSFIQGWLMSNISQDLTYNMRKEISQKINKLPMGYFEQRTVGETLSRITNDIDTFGQGLNQSLTQLITSVTTIIGILIMMLTISPTLTLVALTVVPVSGLLMAISTKISQKFFIGQQKTLSEVNGIVEESYSGQNIITAFNHQEKSIDEFKEKNKLLYNYSWKSNFISGLMFPIVNFVGSLGYVGIVLFGGILVSKGSIGVGDIQAFIQYIRNFTYPLGTMAQVLSQLQSMTASAERVYEFLDAPEEIVVKNPIKLEKVEGNVNFDHVKFGYIENQTIIKNFTSDIKKGQMIAIVGPTGAGKTTMVKLLMKFYDINGGKISIDNHDITKLSKEDLRSYFTMVLQDPWLFKGTIMENIRYGKLDATDKEVIDAAKAAHIHHFIKTLPGGYNMELNEDASNISQGQRQLLTIARAILANKPILILDEATSSVDTRTEVLIQKAMNKLMEGRTTFVIAHRLSTIKNADKILVLKDGDIIEQGTHNELLEQKGFYSELYQSQFNTN
ncbi:ABC transporter ATP-binding protein [Pseudostreptobacillus hongkongensis]|uniref:ABC transporter ATP-binding protein n=1 Tax=Pseudostreptobacillus hongkongensis TaxID=1162717 RepID=UPI0008314BB9|nr:ABC transporter ATP-binding protein [Pseudostreptobacillus hongkongensis]